MTHSAPTQPEASDQLVRRRRSRERASFGGRSVALVLAAVGFAITPPRPSPAVPQLPLIGVAATLALMVAADLVALAMLRLARTRWYGRLNPAQVVLDTLSVTISVAVSGTDQASVTWPMLVIPVLIGAWRHEIVGALTVWAATSAALIGLVIASPTLYGYQLNPDTVVFTITLDLLVAIVAGLQMRTSNRDLRELEAVRAEMRRLAMHDPLTGLANRNLLRLHAEHGRRRPGRPIAVLLLDLDGFKQVNDAFGHSVGDELLKAVADRLGTCVRETDLVARLGGDEFVVLLDGADDAYAQRVAEHIRQALAEPFGIDGVWVRVGASVGVALSDGTGDPATFLDDLLRTADAGMYRSKSDSRAARTRAARGLPQAAGGPSLPAHGDNQGAALAG